MRERDVPVEGVVSAEEALRHGQTRANEMVSELDDSQRGRHTHPNLVSVNPLLQSLPGHIKGPPPAPGQPYSDEIMSGLAKDSAQRPAGQAAIAKRELPHPLADIRVIDFGEYLAGPFGPMLLSDLGAKVIKVERLEGDRMRYPAQPFLACQRGKIDLAVDLKSPAGLEIIYRLVKRADVVHHNQRPGVAERLKIDYAFTLKEDQETGPDLLP